MSRRTLSLLPASSAQRQGNPRSEHKVSAWHPASTPRYQQVRTFLIVQGGGGEEWPFGAGQGCSGRAALGPIRRDNLRARLGMHWEAGCLHPCASFPLFSGSTAMSIFSVELLCTQKRWNPEVVIIFFSGQRLCLRALGYFAAAHGAVRPNTGFVGSLFFISPRTGHGSSKVFEVLPNFSCGSWACAFRGINASIIFSGPIEAEERGTCFLSRRAGSSGLSWRILSLVKRTPNRHRAGFEPQHASSLRQVGESPPKTRRSRPSLNDDPSLCATTYTFGGVGDLNQRRSVIATLRRPPPHQDWGRAGTAGNRFARDDIELGPQLGETIIPENGLVKPPRARRNTRALSPAGMFGGKAPLRLAAQ
jgi:hypothetical protein